MQVLNLHGNQIGDTSMISLADALGKGALAQLNGLFLSDNQISDAGLSALAKAITPGPSGKGALPQLKKLYLHYNQIGDVGMQALAGAVSKGALDHLTVCWRPTALFPCPETWHVHSPDPEVLFHVHYAVPFACWQQDWRRRHDLPRRRSGEAVRRRGWAETGPPRTPPGS